MLFRHPCDRCLVQACCINACEELFKFIKKRYSFPVWFMSISAILSSAGICLIFSSAGILSGLMFVLAYWIFTAIGSFGIIKITEKEKLTTGFIIFISIISPFVFFGFLIEFFWVKTFRKNHPSHSKRLGIDE